MERAAGDPSALHALGLPDPPRRLVRWCDATRPGLVLGSAQSAGVVDTAAAASAGVEVARRHSGGGTVMVGGRRLAWADIVIARGDPLWVDDVGRASWWLGACWERSLDALGIGDLTVHDGAMVRGPWAGLVCFAGTAPGEVLAAGRKIVGISQRRTRAAALFQVAVLLTWDPGDAVAALALSPGERAQAVTELGARAVGLDQLTARPVPVAVLEEAFVASLAHQTP